MLHSAEHEILKAHKYKNIKDFFSCSDKPIILFFLVIDVKMPTTVGILTLMSRKKSCSAEMSMKIFITSGQELRIRRGIEDNSNIFSCF